MSEEITDLWDAIENITLAIEGIRDTLEPELEESEALEYVDDALARVQELLEKEP